MSSPRTAARIRGRGVDVNALHVAGKLPDPFEGAAPFNTAGDEPRPLSPAERIRALGKLGPVVRLATGLDTFDANCRGGVPTRRLVVLGGAPGAGKTTLAVNLGWRWAKAGVAVTFKAVDEGYEGILMRIAQLEGFSPESIEERDPVVLERLASLVEATPLDIVDGDEGDTVEKAVAVLARREATAPRVLIVDSLQTVRSATADETESPRERIDRVVRVLKRARDTHGFLIVVTSELARGAYRSRNVAEAINDLAAFKESGGIEYAAQTALVLRSVPEESSLVDVTVPKNRAYKREAFRLKLDHRTTAMTEVDMPAESSQSRPRPAASTVEADARAVFRVLLSQPGAKGKDDLCTKARAAGVHISNDRIRVALQFLLDRSAVEDRPEKGKPRLFARPDAYRTTTAERAEEPSDEP